MLASGGANDLDRLDPAWRELPIDLANARPFLQRTLNLVHRHTPCAVAALALLDVTPTHLVRVGEIGDAHLPARWPRRIRSSEGLAALGAHAVLRGEDAEGLDTRSAGGLQAFRGTVGRGGWDGLRSALAWPIRVADRTVGVMLVGSTQPEVLRSLGSFLRAAAQQICLALILAQRVEERRAFAFASSTALHAHEILKRVDQLGRHPDREVRAIGVEIEQLVDALDQPTGEGAPESGRPTRSRRWRRPSPMWASATSSPGRASRPICPRCRRPPCWR